MVLVSVLLWLDASTKNKIAHLILLDQGSVCLLSLLSVILFDTSPTESLGQCQLIHTLVASTAVAPHYVASVSHLHSCGF
jgi:hypothetical protein